MTPVNWKSIDFIIQDSLSCKKCTEELGMGNHILKVQTSISSYKEVSLKNNEIDTLRI